jgi:mono/diheme cytochrome c family protein
MRLQLLRGMNGVRGAPLFAVVLALACSSPRSSSGCDPRTLTDGLCGDAARYLNDASFRRSELAASLLNPKNGYSALRLANYGTDTAGNWDALPEWNPRVARVENAELDAGVDANATLPASAAALVVTPDATRGSVAALVALGAQAFASYPVQMLGSAAYGLASRARATHYGFWQSANDGAGGIVRAEMADGSAAFAMTCATCHARQDGETIATGLPNTALDLGALLADATGTSSNAFATAARTWGPGRLDVSSTTGTESVKFPDLRAVRDEPYLQADATVEQNDVVTLAIRIETLIITSQNDVLRPPRQVALALAAYVWRLSSSLPAGGAPSADALAGEQVFDATCSSCHTRPEYSGSPVALDVVLTDPVVGNSPERGTGFYRVPSLHGVSTRGPLLHDGSVTDLASFFDPVRQDANYAGGRLGAGPVHGHPFGLERSAEERAELVAFLRTL